MKQAEKKEHVLYMGRYCDKDSFRTFVFSKTEKKLAESWHEYEQMISSGLWFDEPPIVNEKVSKGKHTDGSANS